MDAKIKVFGQKINFWLHKTIKYAKKSGIYTLISHKYPILVRSTGIERLGNSLNPLIYKGFKGQAPNRHQIK